MAKARSAGSAIGYFVPADQPGTKIGNSFGFTVPLLLYLRFTILACNRDVEGGYTYAFGGIGVESIEGREARLTIGRTPS